MAIGTAAPRRRRWRACPHHMIGVADPAESWSVSRFTEAADRLRTGHPVTREAARAGGRHGTISGRAGAGQ
ncbi:MAG: hypothetical protein ACLU38_15825 [Dysosmobacter sp.]